MKVRRLIISAALLLLVAFFIVAMRPVPTPQEKDCLTATGVVVQLYESGEKDITIRLKDVDQTFYINRGVEAGLDIKQLRENLINNVVTIKYPDYWTPLDPAGNMRHVSVLDLNGEKIFSELKN